MSDMATEQLKELVEGTIRKNKGPFGIVASILSIATIVLTLPADYLLRLQEAWIVIAVPSFLILIGSLGQAYLTEQHARTVAEEKIAAKLNEFSVHIERIIANHFDDRMYFDQELTKFTDEHNEIKSRLDRIYTVLEKRCDKQQITHTGNTEQFLHDDRVKTE